jgi:hypothetical protein
MEAIMNWISANPEEAAAIAVLIVGGIIERAFREWSKYQDRKAAGAGVEAVEAIDTESTARDVADVIPSEHTRADIKAILKLTSAIIKARAKEKAGAGTKRLDKIVGAKGFKRGGK